MYLSEPDNQQTYTAKFDQFYTRFAYFYNFFLKLFPAWRRWISQVLPYLHGPRILEVSFGTGYLFNLYDQNVELYGIEYNREMIKIARRKLRKRDRPISLLQADVNHLPLKDGIFETVVNTMAFTGYPNGKTAMAELNRVLKRGGYLVMVDVNYPHDRNRIGILLTRLWIKFGDIIRDMDTIFKDGGFQYLDKEIGGWGSIHLYVATKVR